VESAIPVTVDMYAWVVVEDGANLRLEGVELQRLGSGVSSRQFGRLESNSSTVVFNAQ
jgi:hypothetical protein